MITEEQFTSYTNDLNEHISDLANIFWGGKQNDADDKLTAPYRIKDYNDLLEKTQNLTQSLQNYAKNRYFKFRCAMCDEYLFDCNEEVQHNPVFNDRSWDFAIRGHKFDLKGSRIFYDMDPRYAIENPDQLITRLYSDQSRDSRFGINNRIFLIHHSFIDRKRNDILRCKFDFKKKAIRQFLDDFGQPGKTHFYPIMKNGTYTNSYATVIFIIENENGTLEVKY